MGKHEEKWQRQEDGPGRGRPGRTGPGRGRPGRTGPGRGIAPERSTETDHPKDRNRGQHQSVDSDQRA